MNCFSVLFAILFGVLFFSFGRVNAQSRISGQVLDGADQAKLGKAAIAVLQMPDSILVNYTWSGDDGRFSVPLPNSGSYKVIISYPKYADYVMDVLSENKHQDIGLVKLSKISVLIEEVEVIGRLPVTIKGDTIIYDAGSFKVEKNAKAEDLLRTLPGITVDGSGKITAQGKQVQKVLLDGEEFFGNDPKLITRNIRADMVSTVQVYEKKSELATRTGVDDGERTQTIDIRLREDSKKGMFGEGEGGIGTDKYYMGEVMVNRFDGAQKIAVFGNASNDGQGEMMLGQGEQEEGEGNGSATASRGIPKVWSLGASYIDKSKNDKHKLNTSYRINRAETVNNSTYTAQDNYPENASLENNKGRTKNLQKSQQVNLRYDVNIDSLSSATVLFDIRKGNRKEEDNKEGGRQDLQGNPINETQSKNQSSNRNEAINIDVMMTRKFKKERRSVTLNARMQTNKTDGTADYYSFAKYLADDRQTVIDQRKRDELDNKTFTTSINYTEPLGQLWTATFGYAFQTNNASTLNQSFNKDPNTGVYSVLDEAVLNDFDFKSIKSSANTGLNFKNEKWTINTSANVDFEDVKRYYKNINNTLKRSQHAVNPRASIGYNLAKNKILTFLYRGRTIQPDLAQIEPLKQNADQLVNYLDNPNLSAGFDNRYIMRFNSFRPLKERSFFLAGSVTQQIKSIAAKVRYYSGTGKRDISYVNMDKQNWSFNLIGNYQMPILRKIGLNMSMGTEATYSTRYSYLSTEKVESELNKTEQVSIRGNLGFSRYKANQLDLSLSLNPGMSVLNSSLQKELNSTVFEFSSDAYIVYYLPIDFKLSFNINQSYSGATKTLPSYHIFNVNGYLSKKLLRSKALETQIYVNDLLNKNNGIERSQNGSSFIQTRNDVVRRYIMLKLIYNFTTIKNGG